MFENLQNDFLVMHSYLYYDLGLIARKSVFGGLRTTKVHTNAQTDQRLCYSLIGKYHIYTCFKRNLNIPASLCRW